MVSVYRRCVCLRGWSDGQCVQEVCVSEGLVSWSVCAGGVCVWGAGGLALRWLEEGKLVSVCLSSAGSYSPRVPGSSSAGFDHPRLHGYWSAVMDHIDQEICFDFEECFYVWNAHPPLYSPHAHPTIKHCLFLQQGSPDSSVCVCARARARVCVCYCWCAGNECKAVCMCVCV